MLFDCFDLVWDVLDSLLEFLSQINNSFEGVFFNLILSAFFIVGLFRFLILPFTHRASIGGMSDSLTSSSEKYSLRRELAYAKAPDKSPFDRWYDSL